MADYEVSGAYVDAVLRSLRERGRFPEIREKLDPATRAMVDNPWSETWHPAIQLEALGEGVVSVLGAPAFEELAYLAMKERYGAIVLPMLKSTLASSNRSPAAVLSKLEGVIKVGMRGVAILWKPDHDTAGMLQVSYPRKVATHVEVSWRGLLRYVFDVTQATGRVERSRHLENVLQYLISW